MWCIGLLVVHCFMPDNAPASGATFCQLYQPIFWSATDSRHTKEQVDTLNRMWKGLCKEGGKK